MNDASDSSNLAKTQSGLFAAWLHLLRVAALPTAVSNILAGFLIASGSWQPSADLMLLIASSGCLYMSGMVLNDWWDRKVDARNRANRPIPSGRISPRSALIGYLVLTLLGVAFAAAVSLKSLAIAICLVAAIASYDCLLKASSFAPLLMGLCRSLNLLLGASVVTAQESNFFAGFETSTIWISFCIGVYITGVTWFARKEAEGDNRNLLAAGTFGMFLGIASLVATPFVFDVAASQSAMFRYIGIVLLVALPIASRAVSAVVNPVPENIGTTVGTALRSLILFDAAIAYLFSQCQVAYPFAILLLLIPSLLLTRWFSPT